MVLDSRAMNPMPKSPWLHTSTRHDLYNGCILNRKFYRQHRSKVRHDQLLSTFSVQSMSRTMNQSAAAPMQTSTHQRATCIPMLRQHDLPQLWQYLVILMLPVSRDWSKHRLIIPHLTHSLLDLGSRFGTLPAN